MAEALPVAAVETVVKAAIRVVPSPGTREEMWRRYRDGIARVAVPDPRAMPWETACAVVPTPGEVAAVCEDVLAAIPAGELSDRARGAMVEGLAHADGEPAPDDGTYRPRCRQCGNPIPEGRSKLAVYCRNACKQARWAQAQKAADAPAS